LGQRGIVTIVTPGYRPGEMAQIAECCDQVVLNSLPQWERFRAPLHQTAVGLRVNPGISYLPDARYDPGRPGGKLGIPLEALAQIDPTMLDGVTGLHFHSNCESPNFRPLWETVQHLSVRLAGLLQHLSWINLGGGYHLPHPDEWSPLYNTAAFLREHYPQLTLYMEPGAPLVRAAGTLVSTVVDVFETGSETIAILDTTVNHLPEVFEYQSMPEVQGHEDANPFPYTLAGATCLAGDVFGAYRFAEPLAVGSRIVFPNVGAYTLSKAHWFNGVALPTLYTIDSESQWHERRRFTRTNYASHLGWDD
jgi:carboxynorspermidine decarboxylase